MIRIASSLMRSKMRALPQPTAQSSAMPPTATKRNSAYLSKSVLELVFARQSGNQKTNTAVRV